MDPENSLRILRGENFIDLVPERFRKQMLARRVTRLVKSSNGDGSFEAIGEPDEVIKLAGRPGYFNLTEEYGVPDKLVEAFDITTQLAMAAGLDALCEAGIPLVQTYRRATTGKFIPDRWILPEALRDETGVIFASAFPGGTRFAEELERYYTWQNRREQLAALEELGRYTDDPRTLAEITRRTGVLREVLGAEPYEFDRRFLFRILSMGHSQFAEYIGARGPNTQVNAACASTTQAIAIAEDWIRGGRCRRVIVIAADNVTGDSMLAWVGAGFLAVGAAAIEDRVEEAALPFDRRRHGTIIGMGACALVIESEEAVRERGMRAIVELLNSEVGNSAFHGTRLDVDHIARVMDDLVTTAELRFGLHRQAIASQLAFMSHETYTPARGGSAAAEIVALRRTFGAAADEILITNTKGFTGHAMGAGIEDVIAVKMLEHGIFPPVPNFKEIDPELGNLNLSRGGRYPVQFSIHLAAGFGSQIAMVMSRLIPGSLDRWENNARYQGWLDAVSGYDRSETEIVKRVLRVKNQGAPVHSPAPSTWETGTGPALRCRVSRERLLSEQAPSSWSVPIAPGPAPEAVILEAPVPQETGSIGTNGRGASQSASTSLPSEPAQPVLQENTSINEFIETVPSPTAAASETGSPPGEHGDPVAGRILEIVAEKTGYPVEMLDLDLDLEADLGIDTVKQAETFLAIREAFDIPPQDNLQLREYPTLELVIGFVYGMRPDLVTADRDVVLPVEPTAPAAPAPQAAQAGDPVAGRILAIVAEKTGYPVEMLDLDLDLEADLGIDTVKQAETFLAIREAFDIPPQDNLQLREYPTLERVIGFVYDLRPDLEKGSGKGEGLTPETPGIVGAAPVESDLLEPAPEIKYHLENADRFPRRVPRPCLQPFLEFCKLTGVRLGQGSRVIVMPDCGGVARELASKLEALGVSVLLLEKDEVLETLTSKVTDWLSAGPVQGVYWLPALDVEPELESLDLAAWRSLNQLRVKNLYHTMRILYDSVSQPGSFLIAATHMGGLHGYGPQGAEAPLGGGVSGFVKAYRRERSEALVKVVDFDSGLQHATISAALLAETLQAPGIVEVGYHENQRYSITLVESPLDCTGRGKVLNSESVFLVTGAAGGITSEIVADLARASAGTFYLLDLVPAPNPADPYLSLIREDREGLKRQLIAEAQASSGRTTPAQVEKKLLFIERQAAAQRAISAVEKASGCAHYLEVDLLDEQAVASVVDQIRQTHGRIDVLIHAAGLEISRNLPDKDAEQFDRVFNVKADGFFNLLHASRGLPIGTTIVFSSVAGRFGNASQTDYSAANDLLCKLSSSIRRWRPGTRAIAIDWTAWQGIGMAARGSLPKIMEAAGIEMLPADIGVPTVRRELTQGLRDGEVLVAGELGSLLDESEADGGLNLNELNRGLGEAIPPNIMLGKVTAASLYGGLQVTTVLDPQIQPFLRDHTIDDTPLLPGVMGIEAFAELASWTAEMFSGVQQHVVAIENIAFLHPFKFYRNEPQTLYLDLKLVFAGESELHAYARLISRRAPAREGLPNLEKVHFQALVRLSREPAPGVGISFTPTDKSTASIAAEEIYKLFFHGPAYRVLDRVHLDGSHAIGWLAAGLPANTDPVPAVELVRPRWIELCFQTAGIWELKTRGRLALPEAVDRVQIYSQPGASEKLFALVEAREDGNGFDAQVVDERGAVYIQLQGYRTVSLPLNVALK